MDHLLKSHVLFPPILRIRQVVYLDSVQVATFLDKFDIEWSYRYYSSSFIHPLFCNRLQNSILLFDRLVNTTFIGIHFESRSEERRVGNDCGYWLTWVHCTTEDVRYVWDS